MIFLVIFPPNSPEVHVKWTGHKSVEDAVKELNIHRENLTKAEKMPYDCYVYEAEEPHYGNKAYELDEVDMNFYEARDKQQVSTEIKETQKKLDEAIKQVAKLAGIDHK